MRLASYTIPLPDAVLAPIRWRHQRYHLRYQRPNPSEQVLDAQLAVHHYEPLKI